MPLLRTLCLSLVLALLPVHAAEKAVQVGALEPGETLQLRFTSGGCFHLYTVQLTLRRTDGSKVCCSIQRGGEAAELELSAEDVAGLDALLEFYRSQPGGRCTTKDSLTVSRVRGDQTVATEEFSDGSCAASGVKGVVTIPSLLERVRVKRP